MSISEANHRSRAKAEDSERPADTMHGAREPHVNERLANGLPLAIACARRTGRRHCGGNVAQAYSRARERCSGEAAGHRDISSEGPRLHLVSVDSTASLVGN